MSQPSAAEERLQAAGLELPAVPEAKGIYRTSSVWQDVLYLSAHGPFTADGGFTHRGRLGAGLSIHEGRNAAAACALSLLSTARAELDSLDEVQLVLTMRGFVNAVPDFEDHAAVLDGASEVMVTAFGDAGRAVRTAVGAAGLPFGLPIVVEASLAIGRDG